MRLEIKEIRRAFGNTSVLRGISLTLTPGTIGCLLGPSGCGKTTLLRIIAGFEAAETGCIRADERELVAPGVQIPPHERRIGMVFQDHALFPHLDVLENVSFGLRGLAATQRRARAMELIEALGLTGLAERRPHELSGGQQQRVAVARALAPDPRLLLLDEPLSSLDADLRRQLGGELRAILKRYGTTALLVTHDQHEAFAIADEVGVMRAGQIEQWATPYDLYHRPATRFVAEFVGLGTFVLGHCRTKDSIETALGVVNAPLTAESFTPGSTVDLLLRPDDVVHDDASPTTAEVVAKAFRGADFLYTLRLGDGTHVLSLVPSHHDHHIGERIGVRLDTDHVVAFPPQRVRPTPST